MLQDGGDGAGDATVQDQDRSAEAGENQPDSNIRGESLVPICVSVCVRERKRALYPAGLTSFQSRAFSVLLRNRISGLE